MSFAENKILIPKPPLDPEAEKRRPPPYNPNTAESIFRGLNDSGENFFDNQKLLEKVRKDIEACRDTAGKSMSRSVIEDIDRNFTIKPPPKIEHKKRLCCSTQERKLIVEACKKAEKIEKIEDITYALGYKSSDETKTEFRKPCVACVGQIKAGKSSLINCILKERTVPQRTTRLTARITTVTYSETKFVGHLNKEKNLQLLEIGQDCRVSDVELPYQDRNDKEKVSMEIRVGRNNKILKNGFDLVDSPGLNENEILNQLCASMEKSVMPLIIYVICGRQGVTESDVKDIRRIKDRSPQLRIIYYVTKLDRSKYDKLQYEDWRKEAKLGPGEHIPDESPMDVAHRRLKKVFRRLQTNGFLPASETWETCNEFFGASLHEVNAMRHFRPVDDPRIDIDHFNNRQYERFERHLMLHLKDMMNSPINGDINYINTAVETVLEKLNIITAKELAKKQEKLQCLQAFKEKEQKIYDSEMNSIESIIAEKIDEMIETNRENFIYVADWYEYSNDLRSQMIDEKNDRERLLRSYRREILDTIERSLNEQLKLLIREFIASKENDLRQRFWDAAKNLCFDNIECSSFSAMLKNRLFYEYEFYEDINIRSFDDCVYRQSEVVSLRIYQLVNQFSREFVSRAQLTSDEDKNLPNPEEFEWRKTATEKVLEEINRQKVIENVPKRILNLFKERHDNFQKELQKLADFFKQEGNVTEEELKFLTNFSNDLRLQTIICLDTKTSINLILDKMKGEIIQKNDLFEENKVERIDCAAVEPILEKKFEKRFLLQSQQFREEISRTVYFSSRIANPRFVEFLGARLFKQEDERYCLTIYRPFKAGDSTLQNYLENNNLKQRNRLQMAKHVSEGIQILHGLQIVQGNISIQNILVEDTNCTPIAKISDLGISKSLGLEQSSCQLESVVCTAPELIDKSLPVITGKADTFSFGVFLWQLLTYKIRPDYDSFIPSYVVGCGADPENIRQAILNGKQPEYREGTPEPLWQLIQACWVLEAEKRPYFDPSEQKEVDKSIPNILKSFLDG